MITIRLHVQTSSDRTIELYALAYSFRPSDRASVGPLRHRAIQILYNIEYIYVYNVYDTM